MRLASGASGRVRHRLAVFFSASLGKLFFIVVLASLTACSSGPPPQPSSGVAYVGPLTLNLRKDLASKSLPVATVKHGDKLDVIELRRRFIRVRTAQGVEGWTDSNLLLTSQQMDDLLRLAGGASKLASQGKATPFDVLNMHSAPARQSPSFFQIAEGESVEVIGHRLAPHSAAPEPVHVPPPPKRAVPSKKSKAKEARAAQAPPMPVPASPPRNWQELSKPRAADLSARAASAAPVVAPQFDDWNLVRTKDGKVGWVLARMLTMSIPDEVAQYAEGHRITAYLPLGEVREKGKDQSKNNWLWTTSSAGQHPFEFDSFRVFVWSIKRHRYETAYIERNVQGFYPIEPVALPGQEENGFSVVLREKDGKLYKRTYGFSGYHVRMISKMPYNPPGELPEVRMSRDFDPPPPPAQVSSGIGQKISDLRKKLFGR